MRHLRGRFGVSSIALLGAVATAGLAVVPVNAGETTLYRYDSLGRLVEITKSGTINNGLNTDIAYDPAGNRTNYEVTGSDGAGSDGGVTGGVGDGGGSSGTGGGGSGSAPETPPSFSVNDIGLVEGEGAVFTITKSGNVQSSYSVSWFTSDASALTGSDYGGASGTLTFAANETTKQISIATIDDNVVEGLETFHLNLNGTSGGATISDPQGAAQITDSDVASNAPPTAEDDLMGLDCGNGIFNLLANDTDPDGDTLSIISVTRVSGAANNFTLAGGSISIANGGDGVLRYTVQDTAGNTDTADVNVTNICAGGGFPEF